MSDGKRVEGLVGWIRAALPELRGVVHAAGVERREQMRDLSAEMLDAVLSAKVDGCWLIHSATLEWNLDFFVAYSSIASVWGGRGHAHYAAANAFLDALMHTRQSQGLPATSVSFGPWAGGGMVGDESQKWLERGGVRALSPARALVGLAVALRQARPHVALADVDWPTFLAVTQSRGRRPLLAALQSEVGVTVTEGGKTRLVEQIEQTSAAQRLVVLCEHVRGVVAQILKCEAALVDLAVGFFDLGMDSLMVVALRRRLESDLGCGLPVTLAMDQPTIVDAAKYVLSELLKLADPERTLPQANGQTVPKDRTYAEIERLKERHDNDAAAIIEKLYEGIKNEIRA